MPSSSLARPQARRRRAAALPPEERRRAIVDAAIPLLVEHGSGVTTRQIAEAAGVAEGTLFRVFQDKAALLHAAAHHVLDPERGRLALAEVNPGLPLDEMVPVVADILLQRAERVVAVLMAVRGAHVHSDLAKPHKQGPPEFVLASHRALLAALTEVFERYRTQLRVAPERAAVVLRALVFGSGPPWTDAAHALTGPEIAAVVLTGVATRTPTEEG